MVVEVSQSVSADEVDRAPALLTEVLSGTTAACVVIIQAMAFGIALYAPYENSPATGAAAGLICVVALCLASGFSRGTAGLISAPTGPSMVMLAAIAAKLFASGVDREDVPVVLACVIGLSGLAQCLIGLFGGGRFIKLVPLPVVAGFMTGSGVLMIASQLSSATGSVDAVAAWRDAVIPVVTAAATFAAMALCKKLPGKIPPLLLGLAVGCCVFYAAAAMLGQPARGSWLVGALPAWTEVSLPWSPGSGASLDWRGLPWGLIGASAVLLAAFTSLDTLLTSLVADTETEQRHNARRELVGQGIGHLLSSAGGGLAGAGTTAATVIAVQGGGRYKAAVFCAFAVIIAMTVGRELAQLLPISVLAGIIMHVAFGLLDRSIVRWFERSRTSTDAWTAVLVAVVTVAMDLMLAVALGFAITIARFVIAQVRSPVVHQRMAAPGTRTERSLSEMEQAVLEANAETIVLFELRGPLVFATAERLFEEMLPDLERGHRIVLSLRRVSHVDLTGIGILRNICVRARKTGGEVVFANVRKKTGLARKVDKSFLRSGFPPLARAARTFKSTDVAVEYLENSLLEAFECQRDVRSVRFEDSQLCAQFLPEDVAVLSRHLQSQTVSRGTRIYQASEPGASLYVVVNGCVDIRLPMGRHHWSRIARIGPGMVFGEVSFHTPGPHTATAVATQVGTIVELTRATFDAMTVSHPDIAVRLLVVVGQIMGRRLRRANLEIDRLNRF